MKKIVIILIAIGILYQINPEIFPGFGSKGAFDENGNPTIIVFTMKQCPPCDDALKYLKKQKINFRHYNINESQENKAIWESYVEDKFLPAIIAGDQHLYAYSKNRLAFTLAMAFGQEVLTRRERHYVKKHFNENGDPIVMMYGADWCPHCLKLRKILHENHVAFIEIDVDKARNKESLKQTLEISGYPTVFVGYKKIDNATNEKEWLKKIQAAKNLPKNRS